MIIYFSCFSKFYLKYFNVISGPLLHLPKLHGCRIYWESRVSGYVAFCYIEVFYTCKLFQFQKELLILQEEFKDDH